MFVYHSRDFANGLSTIYKCYLISQAVLPLLHTAVLAGHPHPRRLLPLSLHTPHHRGLSILYEIRSLNLLPSLPKTYLAVSLEADVDGDHEHHSPHHSHPLCVQVC